MTLCIRLTKADALAAALYLHSGRLDLWSERMLNITRRVKKLGTSGMGEA